MRAMKDMDMEGGMDPDKMGDMMKKMQQMAGGMGLGGQKQKIKVQRRRR